MAQPILGDLSGRVCLVTGANSGIGKEVARGLARLKAHVVMACRSQDRGEAARREIAADTDGAAIELMRVDLASQRSIREFADAFLAKHKALHVLVNNAGIWSQRRQESPEGIEVTWATNALGYFLLTQLLLDRLRQSAPGRIVNVASQLAGDLDLDDLEFARRPYNGVTAYTQSKQANRMLTWALARRLEGTRVTANAMHPGSVSTSIFKKGGGLAGHAASLYSRLFARTPAEGADTVIWLAASPRVEGVTGKFWIDREEVRCRFRDPAAEEALWGRCEAMTTATARQASS